MSRSRSRRPRGPRNHDAQERQPSIQEQTLGVLQSIYAELHAYRQERYAMYKMQGLVDAPKPEGEAAEDVPSEGTELPPMPGSEACSAPDPSATPLPSDDQ